MIHFESCPKVDAELLKLHWLESLFEHYVNGQEIGLLEKPNWVQQTLVTIQQEVERMKIEMQQRMNKVKKRGFKDGK